MLDVDVLIVTALKEEFEAVRDVAEAGVADDPGVTRWEKRSETPPYHLGEFRLANGSSLHVALARPVRMGGTEAAVVAGPLVERLKPGCLAMSGVCAGNPREVGLGDIVFATMTYRYQEGKQTTSGFQPDHRPVAALDNWVRAAQDLSLAGLSSYGVATQDEARRWLLECLLAGQEPRDNPARSRYIPDEDWSRTLDHLEAEGLIRTSASRPEPELTTAGRNYIQTVRYRDVSSPYALPFRVKAGPMASGDVVAKDGKSWEKLRYHGVDTVTGLEMEAATIARMASGMSNLPWIVVKGVMDYADPRKSDRYKPFAARASAEVMFRLLATELKSGRPTPSGTVATVGKPLSLDDTWKHYADVDHDQIFGTRDVLTRLGRALANPDGDRLISIFGEGGAGKTTLAYELVKTYAESSGFVRVAWVSAKFSHLRALGNVEYARRATIGWRDILQDIARQFGLDVRSNPVGLEESVGDALRAEGAARRPCVIVVDNLETVADAELAIRFLAGESVLRYHKVILTTRRSAERLTGGVREFSWRGLPDDAVSEFANYLAADDPDFVLSKGDVDELVAVSAGIPLLVKMAVRLAMHRGAPLSEVLQEVRDPNGNLGGRVGMFLYERAMDTLADDDGVGADAAIGLMNVFCARPSGESFTDGDFFALSMIPDRIAFDRARRAARSLALIRGVDANRRFTVHPLLRDYICLGARALS